MLMRALFSNKHSLLGYFETLRAPVSVAFEATNLLKFLWGDCQITQARNTSQTESAAFTQR